MLVQIRPGSFLEPEVLQTRLAKRREVLAKAGSERAVSAPELIEIDEVNHAGRFDEAGPATSRRVNFSHSPLPTGGEGPGVRGVPGLGSIEN